MKKNTNETSAKTNRALLERLLMRNASGPGFERKRAWSTNPAPSRSVGGTPICLRKRSNKLQNIISHPTRSLFERNHQVYPAVSFQFFSLKY